MSAQADTIETVIVSAQAREQTAEEVPIAMQVVTPEQISQLGAVNLSTMNGYFPGFVVAGQQVTQPNYTLRGIGTSDFGIATDAPVGIYIDGVYTGKTGGALMNFNDIQRVEIIKGPQGTLFGHNSAAGAIAVYTNEPGQNTSVLAHVKIGQFNTRYFDGVANTALSDTVALRFAFVNSHSDGWVVNRTTNKQAVGDNAFGTRMTLKWTPTDSVNALLSWEHEDLDQPARPAFGVTVVPAGARPSVPPVAANFVNPVTAPLQNDAPSAERRKFDGATLRIENVMTDLTLNSITAYRHFKSLNQQDNDGTANPFTYLGTANIEHNTTWQQELRLVWESDHLDWVAGLSFLHSRATQQSEANTNTDTLDSFSLNINGSTPFSDNGLSGNSWSESVYNTVVVKSVSFYGDEIWHLADATNLTLGLRATRDSKSADWYVPLPIAPALSDLLPLIGNQVFQNAALLAAVPVSAAHSWNDMSPRAVIDHHLTPDSMVFASVSRGYQAGGYNIFVPGGRFDPEHMINYEIGTKNYFPDAGITVNTSLFHYRFIELQDISLTFVGNGVPSYSINNSNQSATGVDIDGSYRLSSSTRLFTAAEYINQRFDKKIFFSNYRREADGSPLSIDLKDQPVGTPLTTLMAGANIEWALFTGRTDLTLQGTHTSAGRCNDQIREEFGCLDHGAARTGKPATRVDVSLAWESPDHHIDVTLFINNIFDKRYLESQPNGGSALAGQTAFTLGTPYATITPPRFVGIEVGAGW